MTRVPSYFMPAYVEYGRDHKLEKYFFLGNFSHW
jgi:hypothetical protein